MAISLVEIYQRRLSPLKGYSCAYRILDARCSCSEYGKRLLRRGGLPVFFSLMGRRFDRCARAAAHLRRARATSPILDYESPASHGSGSAPVSSPAPRDTLSTCYPSGFAFGCDDGSCLTNLVGEILCGALECLCSGP